MDSPEITLNPVKILALASSLGRDLADSSLHVCQVRAQLFYANITDISNLDRLKTLFIVFKPGHKGDIIKSK